MPPPAIPTAPPTPAQPVATAANHLGEDLVNQIMLQVRQAGRMQDLAALARCSRQFADTARPHLYRTLNVSLNHLPNRDPTIRSPLLMIAHQGLLNITCNPHFNRHIRRIAITLRSCYEWQPVMIEPLAFVELFQAAWQIEELEVHFAEFDTPLRRQMSNSIVQRYAANLRRLDVAMETTRFNLGANVQHNFVNLRHLNLEIEYGFERQRCNIPLESLSLYFRQNYHICTNPPSVPINEVLQGIAAGAHATLNRLAISAQPGDRLELQHFTALRRLEWHSTAAGCDRELWREDDFNAAWEPLRHLALQSLLIDVAYVYSESTLLSHILRHLPPTLQQLEVTAPDATLLSWLIRNNPQLTHLHLMSDRTQNPWTRDNSRYIMDLATTHNIRLTHNGFSHVTAEPQEQEGE